MFVYANYSNQLLVSIYYWINKGTLQEEKEKYQISVDSAEPFSSRLYLFVVVEDSTSTGDKSNPNEDPSGFFMEFSPILNSVLLPLHSPCFV